MAYNRSSNLNKTSEKKNAKAVVVIEKKKEPEKTVYRVKSKRVKNNFLSVY